MDREYIESGSWSVEARGDRIEGHERRKYRAVEDAEFEALSGIRRAGGLRTRDLEEDEICPRAVEDRVVGEPNLDDPVAAARHVDTLRDIAARQRFGEG